MGREREKIVERGVFVEGRACDDAEASVDHWVWVKNDRVEILGDRRVDVNVGKRLVGRETIGQIGYRDPLGFFAERQDCLDSDFGN